MVINVNKLHENIYIIKKKTNKEIIAVIKSNAYNTGVRCIIKYLKKANISFFAFNTYEEYIYCADLLEKSDVLILETVDYKYIKNNPYNVRLSVNEVTYIKKLKELNKKGVKYALSFDGTSDKRKYECIVPKDLYKRHILIKGMKSTFNKVIDKNINNTMESLYLNY